MLFSFFAMKNFCLNSRSRTGLVAATALLLNACAPGQDTPTPTAGINVSHYLAVGDSYTAGLSEGGFTLASQTYSFPNLLAKQLQGVTANAAFTQPLLDAGTGTGYLDLVDFTAAGFPRTRRVAGQAVVRTLINPAACGGADTVRVLTRSTTSSALPQNLGVPGITLSQLETVNLGNASTATPTSVFNPYFERLLPAADSRTYLQAVTTAASTATFFTYFQGLDDVMPYVRSGGQCGALPNTTLMKNNAKKILDVLTAGGRPGIIAKLPAIITLPLLRQGQGLVLEARLQKSFGDTARIYIEDPFGSGEGQHITNSDYVLATALLRLGQLTRVVVGTTSLMLPYGRDIRNPVRNSDVLDGVLELARINNVFTIYNNELDRLAGVYLMPVITEAGTKRTLDLDVSLFNQVADAISIGGVVYSAEPVRGNVFSLDYYSLTPRGNGLVANAFITAINKAYHANIPAVDVNSLPTTAR
ncbi:hypothetical protein [Hymenobacter terricola]|uniref:hypothetical protein n=1 Tax=Hymenobacter terricola TaxID=2819236 RepID=UPI001B30A7F9|nr:hypothetical protein [Hymenobacter terricola]